MTRAAVLAAVVALVLTAATCWLLGGQRGDSLALWQRRNYRGEGVSLLGGVAAAAWTFAVLCPLSAYDEPGRRVLLAAAIAVAGGALFGAYDDVHGGVRARGLRGHLRLLAERRISTGVVKLVGISVVALCAARIMSGGATGVATVLLDAVVIASCANLANLLDVRPGRALKAIVLAAVAFAIASGRTTAATALVVAGAAAGALPADLRERVMLGDTGANALGGAIGVVAVAATSARGSTAIAVLVVGLTVASERVSFTTVIAATPPLRWLDDVGRLHSTRTP
ncbi:MAG: hypothetical protein ABR520_00250 [Mycobacteriales bacterium]|nr:hypothetical protein [Frankia sp.]